MKAKACLVFDSDLRSITPKWVCHRADPILNKGYHNSANSYFPYVEDSVRILYDFAATFRQLPDHHFKLVDLMSLLYYVRVGSFVVKTENMSSQEAESLLEEQALAFEKDKDYLIEWWDNGEKWIRHVAKSIGEM